MATIAAQPVARRKVNRVPWWWKKRQEWKPETDETLLWLHREREDARNRAAALSEYDVPDAESLRILYGDLDTPAR